MRRGVPRPYVPRPMKKAPLTYQFILPALLAFAACASFLIAPGPASADPVLFSNPTPIAIPTSGFVNPPSEIKVNGLNGPITDVRVQLKKFGHTSPDHVDMLLVGPNGESMVLMSDACGDGDVEDVSWVFSRDASPMTATGPCGGFN